MPEADAAALSTGAARQRRIAAARQTVRTWPRRDFPALPNRIRVPISPPPFLCISCHQYQLFHRLRKAYERRSVPLLPLQDRLRRAGARHVPCSPAIHFIHRFIHSAVALPLLKYQRLCSYGPTYSHYPHAGCENLSAKFCIASPIARRCLRSAKKTYSHYAHGLCITLSTACLSRLGIKKQPPVLVPEAVSQVSRLLQMVSSVLFS